MKPHVTIVGSGIAAMSAAVESLTQGAEVTVVKGRPGETALTSGAWDIGFDPMRYRDQPWQEIPPPAECLERILQRHPHHPYSFIKANESTGNIMNFLTQAFEQLSQNLSLHLHGSLEHPLLVLTPLGTVKPTAYTLPTHTAGNLREMREARLLIVGIQGIPQFSPHQAASLLKKVHELQHYPYLREVRSAEIVVKGLPDLFGPFDLARQLDREEMIEKLQEALIREANRYESTHVALPAIMGIEQSSHIFYRLTESSQSHWFEMLGLPPSVPGIRLKNQIDRFLTGGKVRLLEGEAVSARHEGRRLVSLKFRGPGGDIKEHPVDRLILATGKFLGGGIFHSEENQRFKEAVLDLPVFADGKWVGEIPPTRLSSPDFFTSQPFATVGVRIGRHLQPVDSRGGRVFENLWAAGSLIGGFDPAALGCGMGVAVGTGTLSGRLAATV